MSSRESTIDKILGGGTSRKLPGGLLARYSIRFRCIECRSCTDTRTDCVHEILSVSAARRLALLVPYECDTCGKRCTVTSVVRVVGRNDILLSGSAVQTTAHMYGEAQECGGLLTYPRAFFEPHCAVLYDLLSPHQAGALEQEEAADLADLRVYIAAMWRVGPASACFGSYDENPTQEHYSEAQMRFMMALAVRWDDAGKCTVNSKVDLWALDLRSFAEECQRASCTKARDK